MDDFLTLLSKYSGNTPRYTSYPAVPHWSHAPSIEQWIKFLDGAIASEPASLYIHVPFCSKLCSFCACNKIVTSQYSKAEEYISYIAKEAKLYTQILGRKIPIINLHVGGGTPTYLSAPDITKLFISLKEYFEIMPDAELSFEGHPSSTGETKLQAFYDAGFRRVSFGIQDFNPQVQEAINRIQSLELTQSVTDMARNIGYTGINYDLIYGLPFQTEDTIAKTFMEVVNLKPDRIAFYGYAHLPQNFTQQKHIDKLEIPNLNERNILQNAGRKILKESGYIEIGMDHFALPHDGLTVAMQSGRLARNFMGYTPNFSSIIMPLGISSIGNTKHCFVQNEKDLDQYKNLIDSGVIPIVKGHILTDEEKNTQQVIIKLMTKFSLDATEHVTSKLAHFIEDNLVRLSDDKIIITDLGKPFLRAICASLDDNFSYKVNTFSATV